MEFVLEGAGQPGQREMDENGYVLLALREPPENVGQHREKLAEGLLNNINRHDPNPEIKADESTRVYRGSSRSHFSKTANQLVDSLVNCVYILQTFCGVSQETGRDSEADVVVTNDTYETRPYRLGPVGYTNAVTVILPLLKSLGPENGFFSYCPQSAGWTQQEFEQRLKSKDIPMEEMRVPLSKALLVPAGLVVQFPTKSKCYFVNKTYVPEITDIDEAQLAFEKEHVVPFMRTDVKFFFIDDWRID